VRAIVPTLVASVALAAAACSFDQSGLGPGGDDDAPGHDAPPPADAPPGSRPDAAPTDEQPHLLLTEIMAGTPEFIEILNPGTAPVALDHYYLSDDDDYARLPALFGGSTQSPAISQFDFIVRFPAGAVIAPGQVIVVAIDEASFVRVHASPPDYALSADGDAVPMNAILVGSSPTIANAGEGIALFYWDGQRDLVRDVDLVMAGHNISNNNRLPNKTGLAVDGPDPDDTPSTYLDDAYTIAGTAVDAPTDQSYQRLLPEDGFEIATGGNGITGHDETSEDMTATWTTATFAEPSPGKVPPALLP
jgi:hypothetical protein